MNHLNSVLTVTPKQRGIITKSVKKAAFYLSKGEVVAIPTETVYGLAASIEHENALKEIFELKNRPFYNPLIVHIDALDSLTKVAVNIPEIAYVLARKFWPGPLTMIFEKNKNISDLITAGKKTVAVRIPNHPTTLELIQKLGSPIAAPSANPFGMISPTSAGHVKKYFNNKLNVILDGGLAEKGIESTIIGFKKDEVVLYRHGAISLEMIESIIGTVKIQKENKKFPIAPGMLQKHYSPRTKMILCQDPMMTAKSLLGSKIGILAFGKLTNYKNYHVENLSPSGDMNQAAKKLYAAMHAMDEKGLDLIIAQKFPDVGIGKSINDRLTRACCQDTNFAPNNIFSE